MNGKVNAGKGEREKEKEIESEMSERYGSNKKFHASPTLISNPNQSKDMTNFSVLVLVAAARTFNFMRRESINIPDQSPSSGLNV